MFTLNPAHVDVSRTGLLVSSLLGIAGFILSLVNYFKAKPFFDIGIIITKTSAEQHRETIDINYGSGHIRVIDPTFSQFDGVLTNVGNRTFTLTDLVFKVDGPIKSSDVFDPSQSKLPITLEPGAGLPFHIQYLGKEAPQSVVARIHNGRTWEKKLIHRPVPDSGHKQLDRE
jgi:hypothetical protein